MSYEPRLKPFDILGSQLEYRFLDEENGNLSYQEATGNTSITRSSSASDLVVYNASESSREEVCVVAGREAFLQTAIKKPASRFVEKICLEMNTNFQMLYRSRLL